MRKKLVKTFVYVLNSQNFQDNQLDYQKNVKFD